MFPELNELLSELWRLPGSFPAFSVMAVNEMVDVTEPKTSALVKAVPCPERGSESQQHNTMQIYFLLSNCLVKEEGSFPHRI